MAAMSEKKYEEKYSWEDIKFTIGFEDRNKQPIDEMCIRDRIKRIQIATE